MTDPSRDDDDLAERVAALEESLSDLRTELRRPPRGPLGLPRPPTPRELLRFTERHAIPTTIAVLEANVRALRLLQGALRMTDPERAVGGGASETRDRAERAGRAVLERLDGALSDLQAELEEGDLPRDGEARDIVQDARRLSAEIHDRLGTDGAGDGQRQAGDPSGDSTRTDAPDAPIDGNAGPEGGDGAHRSEQSGAVRIDVEDELRSIKDELDGGGGSAEGGDPDDHDAGADEPDGPDPDDEGDAPGAADADGSGDPGGTADQDGTDDSAGPADRGGDDSRSDRD